MSDNKKNIKVSILRGNFALAIQLIGELTDKELDDLLFKIAYDEASITPYSFICFMLMNQEVASYHVVAATILLHGLCQIEGVYAAALNHVRRAIVLDPDDYELLELLLMIYFSPLKEPLIDEVEARQIALEILKHKPTSLAALRVLYGDIEALNMVKK